MRLLKTGENTHTLETPIGAVLFSYQDPVAVKVGITFYALERHCLTAASRQHVDRFAGTTPVLGVSVGALQVPIAKVLELL